jgi:type II secretory pathway pseudopilin PulG
MNAAAHTRRFTLAELLVAIVLTMVVLPVAVRAVLVASRTADIAAKQISAAYLADRLLAESVLTQAWATDTRTGTFGTDWPGFRWEVTSEPWSAYEAELELVTVGVFFEHRGREYPVHLSTLAAPPETE